MAEVSLSINGKSYGISCDDGQEQRVRDLGQYLDSRLKDIARSGAASSESHLLVLAGLVMADEVFEMRDQMGVYDQHLRRVDAMQQDENLLAQTIDQLADRIDLIADRIQKA